MSCPPLSELEAFVNDELDVDVALRVASHVDECGRCQNVLDTLLTVDVLESSVSSFGQPLQDADERAVDEVIRRLQELPDQTQVAEAVESSTPASGSWIELPSRLGQYELLELVGEGGTGRLYRALDLNLDRIVAVKTLKPELAVLPSARARFEREARACAALRHDHIVSIHQVDAGSPEQGIPPYLVMEFISGGPLRDRLRDSSDVELRQAVEWLRQTALGIDAAHQAGVVHRDIKPTNVLIDDATNRARVVDFGLARLTETDESLTAEGMIAGTPAYMSPEQAVDPASVDGLTDIYSLGIVLYEALTGEVPFRGIMRMVLHQVIHEDPVPPRRLNDRIPRDLQNICLKAVAKEKRLRYQTAGAFAADLERWLNGIPVLARPVGPALRLVRWCRRNPRMAGLSVIVASVLIAGAFDWNESKRDRRRAEALERVAREQAQAANRQRERAFQTMKLLIIELQNEFKDRPGTEDLREKVLRLAMQGLEEMSRDTERGEAADLATATAQNRLGEIYRELDRTADARRMFESAEAIARVCIHRGSNPARSRQILARSLWELGGIDVRFDRTGEARSRFVEALQQVTDAEKLARSDEYSELHCNVIRDRCIALQRLSELESRDGNSNSAASRLIEALELLEGLSRYSPGNPETQRDIGVVLLDLASLARSTGRGDPEDLLQRAWQQFDKRFRNSPEDRQVRIDLAVACSRLAGWMLENGHQEQARRYLQRECSLVAHLQQQAAADVRATRLHAECLLRLGSAEAGWRNWSDAERVLKLAETRYSTLGSWQRLTETDRVHQSEVQLLLATVELGSERLTSSRARIHRLEIDLNELAGSLSTDQPTRARVLELLGRSRELLSSFND